MTRIAPADPKLAEGHTTELFAAVERKLGLVPNAVKVIGRSPAALEGYLGLGGALAEGELEPALQERIAIAVAAHNGCGYCLAAHTGAARQAGVPAEELERAQLASSDDPRAAAVLAFVDAVLRGRGDVDDERFETLHTQGFSDAAIVEIVALVALNTLTNYVNRAAQTELDLPPVELVAERSLRDAA